MRTLFRTVTVAIASSATTALLFAACAADGVTGRAGQSAPRIGPAVTVPTVNAHAAPASPNPAVSVYRQNGASVVNITSLAVVPTRQGQSVQPQGVGCGFILDSDGRIVTNNHVVQDADQLAVTFQDKTTVPAKLVGRDPDNDLAVIQVDPNATDDQGNSIANRIKTVTLGDSDNVVIGETAIAIGSPLGLQQTPIRRPGAHVASFLVRRLANRPRLLPGVGLALPGRPEPYGGTRAYFAD
jgi:S1-C subfamily serine protease